MALTLEIVTPEARVYADTIDTVVIPTTTGEIGILSGHIPLLTQIEHGELRVTKNGVTTLLAVIVYMIIKTFITNVEIKEPSQPMFAVTR